ncbi:unnamed protein product [Paramecium primaurelia]|uniref:Transmembrane protein n=1 Tax=Paramecium primaurelia TaxID=5886 RepID=A0A8S1MT98_PARPR|nr:unnamed protein product [Paramecium primaurelia]
MIPKRFEVFKFFIKILNQQQIQQYQKTLQFSVTYKGQNCQVTEGGKVVECPGSNGRYYCLCEQAIPKTGKILFAFQILSLTSSMFIGIGFRDIIQKNNYQYTGLGYGSYMISQNGYTYSHHNKDVNGKQLSFTYTTNDIIIMEVSIEHKYIKWTRSNNPLATVVIIKFKEEINTKILALIYMSLTLIQLIMDFFQIPRAYSVFQNSFWFLHFSVISYLQFCIRIKIRKNYLQFMGKINIKEQSLLACISIQSRLHFKIKHFQRNLLKILQILERCSMLILD